MVLNQGSVFRGHTPLSRQKKCYNWMALKKWSYYQYCMCNSRNNWTTFWSGFPFNIHTNNTDVSPYIHQYLHYLQGDIHFLPHASLLFSIMATLSLSCSSRCVVIKSSYSIPWRLEKLNIVSCICHSHTFSEISCLLPIF